MTDIESRWFVQAWHPDGTGDVKAFYSVPYGEPVWERLIESHGDYGQVGYTARASLWEAHRGALQPSGTVLTIELVEANDGLFWDTK